MISHSGVAWVYKSPEVVSSELCQPASARVTGCISVRIFIWVTVIIKVVISYQRPVVVGPPKHHIVRAPPRLPTPKVGPVKSVHPRFNVISFVRRVVQSSVRSDPHIYVSIVLSEKFHIMYICVRVSVGRKLSGPGDPMRIQIP